MATPRKKPKHPRTIGGKQLRPQLATPIFTAHNLALYDDGKAITARRLRGAHLATLNQHDVQTLRDALNEWLNAKDWNDTPA